MESMKDTLRRSWQEDPFLVVLFWACVIFAVVCPIGWIRLLAAFGAAGYWNLMRDC